TALHTGSKIGGRLSGWPIVYSQSWAEIKLPPGILRMWQFISFISARVSARKPLMLSAGISDTAPTAKLPLPLATISKRASVVSTLGLSVKVWVFHLLVVDIFCETVWASPLPQLSLTVTLAPELPRKTMRPL